MLELLFDNFDMLGESPGGVEKLRKMILQLAVWGKLVSQDPKDGNATALLEKLAAEKIGLVKRGLVRKQKAAETVQGSENRQIPGH